MIKKISNWIYLKYGVRVKRKHIIMMLILIISIFLLLISLASRPSKNINLEVEPAIIPPAN